MLDEYKVNVPPGISGDWRIEHFNVSEKQSDVEKMRYLFDNERREGVPPGNYTSLKCNGFIIMSDTPDEIRDHLTAIKFATGKVLINGLGLGMILQACLEKESVTHVTVIENSIDVLNLVSEHYKDKYGDRVTFIHSDAFTYKAPANTHYDMVWHDIWNDISSENLPDMHRLHKKYDRCADYQGSWCRQECENIKKREYNR